jgi:hypothetical protein
MKNKQMNGRVCRVMRQYTAPSTREARGGRPRADSFRFQQKSKRVTGKTLDRLRANARHSKPYCRPLPREKLGSVRPSTETDAWVTGVPDRLKNHRKRKFLVAGNIVSEYAIVHLSLRPGSKGKIAACQAPLESREKYIPKGI